MRRIIAFLACIFAYAGAYAQGRSEAMASLRIDRDPVTSAMGGAGAASAASTAFAAFRNAAALPFAGGYSVAASYQMWAPRGANTKNFNIGGAGPVNERLAVAVGFAHQRGETYELFRPEGGGDHFTPEDILFGAGIGYRMGEAFGVGANFKFSQEQLTADDADKAFAADMFLFCGLFDVDLTVGISSLGTKVKSSSGETFHLPTSATFGASWTPRFGGHGFVVNADMDYYFLREKTLTGTRASRRFTAAAGAEYSYKDLVFLRAGYHYGTSSALLPSYASAGLGVQFRGFCLDASCLFASSALRRTFTLGLGYRF